MKPNAVLAFAAVLALSSLCCFGAGEDEDFFQLAVDWKEGTAFTCQIEEDQKMEVSTGDQFNYLSLSERALELAVEIETDIDTDGGEVTAEYVSDEQYTNYFHNKDEELPAERPKTTSGIVGKMLTFKRGQEEVEDPDNPGVMLTGGLQRFAKITSWSELVAHEAATVGQTWKIEDPALIFFVTHNTTLSQYTGQALENMEPKFDKKEITVKLKAVVDGIATVEITGAIALSVDQESSGLKFSASADFTQTVTLQLDKRRILECVRTGASVFEMGGMTYKSDEKVTVQYKYD